MSKFVYVAAMLAAGLSCGPTRHAAGGDDDDNGQSDAGSGNQMGSGIGSSCATDTVTAMSTPLDIYIMLDQSGSMDDEPNNPTKWESVTQALDGFVTQPNQSGVSVGIQYFALNNESCTASDYATPDVEISALPGIASKIEASIAAHSPTTGTPTSAALQGAIDHAQSWATSHTGDTVVVVLATDGEPDECGSLTDVDNIAKAGVSGTPKIPTFVIGLQDDTGNLSALNGIASAGGTGSAFIVNAGSNAESQFIAALNAIRGSLLGCTYQIPVPSSGSANFSEVNIVYTPGGGGSPMTIPQVPSMAMCPSSGNAWYYDNPSAPTEIILCSSTCGTIEADTTGSVGITLGCMTVIQ
jgi:von Willebrand factor type A domain